MKWLAILLRLLDKALGIHQKKVRESEYEKAQQTRKDIEAKPADWMVNEYGGMQHVSKDAERASKTDD